MKLKFRYTNHKGITEDREVHPLHFARGSEWHGPDAIILVAYCMDCEAIREFDVSKIVFDHER